MDKKILIFKASNLIQPVGGPLGYLFNLKERLPENFVFLPEDQRTGNFIKLKTKLKKLPFFLKDILSVIRENKKYHQLNKLSRKRWFDFSQYSAVHFHDVFDLFTCKTSLEGYSGKVILTVHCPNPPHIELYYDNYTPLKRFVFRFRRQKYEQMAEFAYLKSDAIIIPTKDSDDGYSKKWPFYDEFKNKNLQKYHFVLTGAKPLSVSRERTAFLASAHIPENSFVIGFLGRHIQTKGFDVFVSLFDELSSKYSNLYFLTGGQKTSIKTPKSDHWVDLGWVSDRGSFLNAINVLLIPNEETYFDLVLLECLSIGTYIIASNNGGNKFFSNLEGVSLASSKKEIIDLIEKRLVRCPDPTDDEIRIKNHQLFNEYFSLEKFASSYVNEVESIVDEK